MAVQAENHRRWDKLCELVSVARALPDDARKRFLSRECVSDPDMEREIAELLALDSPPSGFLADTRVNLSGTGQAYDPESRRCVAGDVLSERFEIVRFIGAGGMGEVYEARDRELGEAVALKVLRPGRLPEQFLNDRFRREIRLARRITHPNVCRVYDFSRHAKTDGSTLHYYLMELVQGETLAARLASGQAFEDGQAMDLARQISAGLSAAHAAGIVHRDLKPGNIILTASPSSPRVVITDFGLAAPFEGGPGNTSLRSTGLALGTPGYMAPEQLFGGPITPATDVYAYGVVLHELIARTHPQSAEAESAEIPSNWKAVIQRCMELDPKLRFAAVNEACAALSTPLSTHGWSPAVSRRRLLAAGAGTVAVSLLAGAYRFIHWNANLPKGALVVVSPLLNTTGDSRFDGLTPALEGSLAQSAHLNVWRYDRMGAVLQSMRLAPDTRPDVRQWRDIAFREKAPLLVFSTVSRVAAGFVLSIHSELIGASPEQPARNLDRSFTASGPNGVFEALHDAAHWIRETAGEDAVSLSAYNRLPQDITSSSWEALDLFSRAQLLDAAGKPNEAIPLLQRAVEMDPQFAMGFMRLGDILNTQRRSEEGFEQWRRAIALARSQHLSAHESLNIESRYAIEIGDYAQAEPTLREWVQQFPNDPAAVQLMASCLIDLGRYPEGIKMALAAEKMPGSTAFAVAVAIRGYAITNRLPEMDAQIAMLERISPRWWTVQERGIAAALRGDDQGAEKHFLELSTMDDALSRGASLRAALAADRGDFDGAAKLLQEGIGRDREAGQSGFASRKAAGLAFVEGVRGNSGMARTWALEAVSIMPSPPVVTLAASALARFGHVDAARGVAAKFPTGSGGRNEAARLRMRGEILAAQGDTSAAVDLFDRCAKLESALRPKEYLAHGLDLAGQRGRARLIYEQICKTPFFIWDSPESEWPGIRFLAQKRLQ
jgi:eukaryotic-like serine/threonine-protein kinase